MLSQPLLWAACTTARMAALSPAQSPPLVRIPIRFLVMMYKPSFPFYLIVPIRSRRFPLAGRSLFSSLLEDVLLFREGTQCFIVFEAVCLLGPCGIFCRTGSVFGGLYRLRKEMPYRVEKRGVGSRVNTPVGAVKLSRAEARVCKDRSGPRTCAPFSSNALRRCSSGVRGRGRMRISRA